MNSLVRLYRGTTTEKTAEGLLVQLQKQAALDLTVLPVSQGDEYAFAARGTSVVETSFGPGWQLGFFGMGAT